MLSPIGVGTMCLRGNQDVGLGFEVVVLAHSMLLAPHLPNKDLNVWHKLR